MKVIYGNLFGKIIKCKYCKSKLQIESEDIKSGYVQRCNQNNSGESFDIICPVCRQVNKGIAIH